MKGAYKNKVAECISRIASLVKKDELGKHLAIAFNEHDISWLSDEELYKTLNEYCIELEIDGKHSKEDDLNKIIKQGMNLNTIFDDDEDDEF
jgi:hypothetical protein